MRDDFYDDEDPHAAVRAEAHHQAACCRDVFPAFTGTVPGSHGRVAQLHLQSRQHLPVAGGQDAVVTDVDEAVREDVLGVAPYELHTAEGHLLDLAVIAVVLILEGDAVITHGADAPVPDGHAVGVAGEVLQRALRPADRRFGIDHPGLGEAFLADGLRYLLYGREFRHELGPEHVAEGLHREEERLLPAVLDLRKRLPLPRGQAPSAAWHDAVQVGMEHQVAAPGVQQGRHPQPHPGLLAEGVQRVPCGVEEGRVCLLLMAEDEPVQHVRDGEHHVEVDPREEFLLAREQPRLPLGVLAAGTVAVPTAVVERMLPAALGTHRHVPAKGGRAAVADVLEHGGDVRGGMIPRGPVRTEPDQGFGYAALHGYFTGKIRSVGPTQRVSYGAVATFR